MASQHSRQTGSVTWLRTSGRQDHLKPWQRWEEKPALNEIIYLPSQSRHPSTPSSWAPWCLPESWLLTQESVAIPWSSLLSFLWGADQNQACFRCFELLYYFSLKSPPSVRWLPATQQLASVPVCQLTEGKWLCSFFSPPGWDLQLACPGVFLSDAYRIIIALQNR